MKILRYMAYVLVLIGALNWGLIGFFGFNLVSSIFGDMTVWSRMIYALVGLSAIITAFGMHHCESENETCRYGNCDI